MTSHRNDLVLTGLVEEKQMEALQGGYEAEKEILNISLYHLVVELIVDIIQEGKMEVLLMRNIEAVAQCERFMDA